MAGILKPPFIATGLRGEATWTVNGVLGTSGAGGTIASAGLFNGTNPDEWNTVNVMYWGDASAYLDITINQNCNIWRTGTVGWDIHKGNLKIEKWNGTSWDLITGTITQVVTQITNATWEKTISNLSAGRYKFSYSGAGRLDSEWYIEDLARPIIYPLSIKNNLTNMEIGDIIPCKYVATSGVVGTFSELGTTTASEIPVVGTATPNGSFNFIKVDKGLCVADRVIQNSVSWDVLNVGKMIEGMPYITRINPIMTSATVPSPCVVTASYIGAVGSEAYKAFNGNVADYWYKDTDTARPTGGEWLKIDFGLNNAKPLYSFSVTTKYISTNFGIKDWVLYGSNDDVTYIQISSGVQSVYTLNTMVNSAIPYRYYRYNMTSCYDTGYPNRNIICEIVFYNYPIGLIRSLSGGNSYCDYANKRIVLSLLHGEGTDGSTTFSDSAPIPNTITTLGTPTIKTDNKKFGNSSIYCGTSGDALIIPNSNRMNFENDNFTIDMWIYPSVLDKVRNLCSKKTSSESGWYMAINSSGQLLFSVSYNGASWNILNAVLGSGIVAQQWNHIIVERIGGVLVGFVNGIKGSETPITNVVNSTTVGISIGSGYANSVDANAFLGYIDEVRIIKGSAEYTTNFTPPTQPYSEPKNTLEGAFSSTTDKGLGVAYPDINEYDKFIYLSNLNNKVTPNDANIWNHGTIASWTEETPILAIGANTLRVNRKQNTFAQVSSTTVSSSIGFRPVLQYIDDNVIPSRKPTSCFS